MFTLPHHRQVYVVVSSIVWQVYQNPHHLPFNHYLNWIPPDMCWTSACVAGFYPYFTCLNAPQLRANEDLETFPFPVWWCHNHQHSRRLAMIAISYRSPSGLIGSGN